ncbi:cytochrome P450 [Nonomuraea sp. NPDC049400]|uniref:cytochrome P450 n=1 Tax=Nonomuraea sp. NPDC049400 TaxID=3364352 RepID=UPI0037B534AF
MIYNADPLAALTRIGAVAVGGRVVRLGMGGPYLVSHPDHVRQVLRDSNAFVRRGMFWDQIRLLVGQHGVFAEGSWKHSRDLLQPHFTARAVSHVSERMHAVLARAIDQSIVPGQRIPLTTALTRITYPVLSDLCGGWITENDLQRLGPAYHAALRASTVRILLSGVPDFVPLPGDRVVARAVAMIDAVVYPRIRQARAHLALADESTDTPPTDVLRLLCRAWRDEPPSTAEQAIRDDVVALHGAVTESTVSTLSWLWPILHRHPGIVDHITREVDELAGDGPLRAEHLPALTYTQMTVREALRLYPSAWVIPRQVNQPVTVGGVTMPAGATVLVSPFLMHRLPQVWERPHRFDPTRFAPGRAVPRGTYLPFGAGQHQCLGRHFFETTATLLLANTLRRYRPVIHGWARPQLGPTNRPAPITVTFAERRTGFKNRWPQHDSAHPGSNDGAAMSRAG